MSPPEFEAAAGCSKGKNWKVCLQKLGCFAPALLPSPYVPHTRPASSSLVGRQYALAPPPFLPHPVPSNTIQHRRLCQAVLTT